MRWMEAGSGLDGPSPRAIRQLLHILSGTPAGALTLAMRGPPSASARITHVPLPDESGADRTYGHRLGQSTSPAKNALAQPTCVMQLSRPLAQDSVLAGRACPQDAHRLARQLHLRGHLL